MGLKFNTDRPKVSDEEIAKNQDFQKLVQQFKEQSIKQAKGDESWWKNKTIKYSTVIAGITVVCIVTYSALFTSNQQKTVNDKITTSAPKSTTTPVKRRIQPPSDALALKAAKYTVNNQKGGTVKHTTGTTLKIPANSFVDNSGKQIVGDVIIEYREFHSVADIIGSGIPMQYDSAGNTRVLETAGMFDISGNQNGQPVAIATNKKIDVQLASLKERSNFHQYQFDTASGNWLYMQPDFANKPSASASTAARKKEITTLKNDVEVILPKRSDSVAQQFTRKVKQLPTYAAPAKPRAVEKGRPSFKFEGSTTDFPELAAFDNVLFEVGPENKNYSQELHEITWEDVKVSQGPVKGVNYLLSLKYRARIERLVVYPVLSGKDLETATASYKRKFTEYTTLSAKREAEELRLKQELEAKQAAYLAEQKQKELELKRLEAEFKKLQEQQANAQEAVITNQSAITRLFSISSFGIYNSDCPHKLNNGGSLVRPVFVNAAGKPILPRIVYLVNHGNQTAFGLQRDNGFEVPMATSEVYSFCALVGDKIYTSSKESIATSLQKKSNRFDAVLLETGGNSNQKLKEALEL
jgi:hypothetical protein